jgi:glutamyl-tRNA synthetase
MSELKERAKTTVELSDIALFYAKIRPLEMNESATSLLSQESLSILHQLHDHLKGLSNWSADELKQAVSEFSETQKLKLGKVAQPLRAALTGTNISPGVFQVMAVLGREETLGRLDDVLN